MATIKLKGPGLNDWFAEQLVKDHGPEGARAKCCGPALAAVERVIARMESAEERRQFAHAEEQIERAFYNLVPKQSKKGKKRGQAKVA